MTNVPGNANATGVAATISIAHSERKTFKFHLSTETGCPRNTGGARRLNDQRTAGPAVAIFPARQSAVNPIWLRAGAAASARQWRFVKDAAASDRRGQRTLVAHVGLAFLAFAAIGEFDGDEPDALVAAPRAGVAPERADAGA